MPSRTYEELMEHCAGDLEEYPRCQVCRDEIFSDFYIIDDVQMCESCAEEWLEEHRVGFGGYNE